MGLLIAIIVFFKAGQPVLIGESIISYIIYLAVQTSLLSFYIALVLKNPGIKSQDSSAHFVADTL